LAKTIEQAISTGISYIDFLRGDESYKQHFVNNRIDMIKFVAILNPNLDETEVISFINNYQE
jgi:CelD/BcsL family acetyltransferase involved in cellulose biosynthesis